MAPWPTPDDEWRIGGFHPKEMDKGGTHQDADDAAADGFPLDEIHDAPLDERPLFVPAPMLSQHPIDPEVPGIHVQGAQHMPHSHVVKEAWSHDLKQAAAKHIDRWHWRPRS